MKFEREEAARPETHAMDRQVIHVDFPPTHAGITAALRRERDFAELLRRLN
jgi:hypothetical protein